MKEQIVLQMKEGDKQVAEQDVTTYTGKEVRRLVEIQKEMGRTCNIKRIWIEGVIT